MNETKIIQHTSIMSAQYEVIEESDNYYIASSKFHDNGEAKLIKKGEDWIAYTGVR